MAEVLRTGVSRRYLGLELLGARNQRTAMAAIEYFPREKKIFLLDVYERILVEDDQTPDEGLIESILEMGPRVSRLAVHAPLNLPPCIECTRKTCPMPSKCTVPAVRFMRDVTKKKDVSFITPYTQRPVETWIRHEVLKDFEPALRFEVEEALGSNRAPLTTRIHFLKRHLPKTTLIEVWPKLSILMLGARHHIHKRALKNYRDLDRGIAAREEILENLSANLGLFIYDRDRKKLSQQLSSFDAFICALTALLYDENQCRPAPRNLPASETWVAFPNI